MTTTDTTAALWAVRVHGLDDVIAAKDRDEADAAAARINAAYDEFKARPTASKYDVRWSAEVIVWPYSAESHAAQLATGDERWEG